MGIKDKVAGFLSLLSYSFPSLPFTFLLFPFPFFSFLSLHFFTHTLFSLSFPSFRFISSHTFSSPPPLPPFAPVQLHGVLRRAIGGRRQEWGFLYEEDAIISRRLEQNT